MKILFMGTPDFAREILRSLCEAGEDVAAVVTQPDRPKGRGYRLVPSPVKEYAVDKGIPLFQPETLKDGAFSDTLSSIGPELIIVAAYGKILPPYIINYPKYGCVNAHASILPKYRGASPIQRAIMNGERESGVCAMYMDEGLDTGDVILCKKVAIDENDNFETVHDKLAEAGSAAILDAVGLIKRGEATRTKQNDAESTYAEKITKEDRVIDFSAPALSVHNKIRGLSPFPRAFASLPNGKVLQITRSELTDKPFSGAPGEVVSADKDGFCVMCADGALLITEVIPEGKGKMSSSDFVRGRQIAVGERLGVAEA
ncbi:MAG: methionyl-tRNA formyltransferase [Clostridia bacterium]|nr:methionyl-tRNA formyltransferase [Clostridia bacterium]